MDAAFQLLQNRARQLRGPTLWLADEQTDASVIAAMPVRADWFALSNRCDIVAALRARHVNVELNDFDIAAAPPFAHAIFRVAKEKALVHHIVNAALARLPPHGTLALAGYKNDGTKTYIEKAAARARCAVELERQDGALLGVITRGDTLGEPLDDQAYAHLRELAVGDYLTIWTKPGIFGWKKIDEGSRFLLEHIDRVFFESPRRVLDLGCGYGYLGMLALRHWQAAQLLAVDNNIAAVHACARNLQIFGDRARCVCSDIGKEIGERFDAILCNPPFHQGFAHERELIEHFLRQTRRLLERNGRALFVVNQFIGIESAAAPLFSRVETIARNKSFKLIVLE